MTVLMVIAFATGLFFVVVLAGSARATDSNQVDFWCEDGIKIEPIGTPSFTVPSPPDGFTWTLLVLKSGTDNEQFPNPIPGQSYTPSNGKDVSHAILCMEPIPDETTTTTAPPQTTTTTAPPGITTTTTAPPGATPTTTAPPGNTTTTAPPGNTTTTEAPPVGGVAAGGGSTSGTAVDTAEFRVGVGALALAAALVVLFLGRLMASRRD